MNAWLSRYRPRYLRSLTYMLQATEYDIGDYVEWYGRTRDFSRVEQRKSLVKTPKALVVLALAWVIELGLLALAVGLVWTDNVPFCRVLALAVVIVAPFATGYLLVVPLLVVRFLIQQPLEWLITRKSRKILMQHPGLKIAVAGSFGKTSMREILRIVLAEGKRVAAPPHSYNTPLGISRFIRGLSGEEEVLIFELGEYYPGDVRKLCQLVNPQVGIITGVNEAHLGKFKSLDRTAATIFELADWIGGGPIYVNGESDLARKSARPGHLIYDRDGAGDWQVKNASTGLEGTKFTLTHGKEHLSISSHLLGLHQIGPLAAAAAVASSLGLTDRQIEAGLNAVTPFEHRMQPRTDSTGVTTLDDSYNGNPDGARAVISFLGEIQDHRRFYVTPGLVEMGKRSAQVHREIGRELARAGIERVVLIRDSATPFIAEALEAAHFKGEIMWYDDGPAAFAALPHLTVAGDVVLLQNDWPDQYS